MFNIFSKPTGFRLPCGRYCDPLRAYRALLVGGCDDLLDARGSPVPEVAAAAEAKLCDIARTAFAVPPLDPATGRGYTDELALDALDAFLEFCDRKKWTGRRSPTR